MTLKSRSAFNSSLLQNKDLQASAEKTKVLLVTTNSSYVFMKSKITFIQRI